MRVYLKERVPDSIRIVLLDGWHIWIRDLNAEPVRLGGAVSHKLYISSRTISVGKGFPKHLSDIVELLPERACLFMSSGDCSNPTVISEEEQGMAWAACLEQGKECFIWGVNYGV